jgi:hypothetical protein
VRRFIVSTLAIVSLCLVGRAECQPAATPRSGPALFRGAEGRGVREGGLALTVLLFGGYDDAVLADQARDTSKRPSVGSTADGISSGLGVGLLYSPRPTVRAWANSAIRYYPGFGDFTTTYHQIGLSLTASLNQRISIHANPHADYSPRYSLRLFPVPLRADPEPGSAVSDATEASAPDVDYSVIRNAIFRYGATVAANISVSDRSSVNLDYGYSRRESDVALTDMEVQVAGASFRHRFTRDAWLGLGYTFQEGTHRSRGPTLTTQAQSIDIGVNYMKPLSRTRRTFLRFHTGSVVTDSVGGRRLSAIGSASFVHHMGRTWTGQVQYRRALRYVDGFDRPIFADTVSTALNGLLTRRLEFAANASYFTGTVGVNTNSPPFDSYSAFARLRRSLTRTLAAYVEYYFYHYNFDEGTVRPVGLPATFARNGVRVGLTLWIPLID